ncbi:hypothetical protein FD16_GL001488 [Paucilactobacillus suebicus DSM 5007 = KCTC 3549]|uniref:Uncharacterized protein n=2 Tax=Paucilactobacillus suebicus TaxID=152335 RepID=A0A0R1W5T1_9LACO|nr:hypothetical protein FD16_GL001488 [Paucilactobacillus suebicus DSM 5007 = KCTC 3549]
MNMEKQQAAYAFINSDNHEAVIYGAMKKIGITKSHPKYEDFSHEGWLTFVETYLNYQEEIDLDVQKFMNFVYWKIRWRLLDILRRENSQNTFHEFSLDNDSITDEIKDAQLFEIAIRNNDFNSLLYMDIFKRVYAASSVNEQRYLLGCVINHQSMTELARLHGVSKATVSHWKKNVQQRVQIMNEGL